MFPIFFSGIYECQVSTTPPRSHLVHLSVAGTLITVFGGESAITDPLKVLSGSQLANLSHFTKYFVLLEVSLEFVFGFIFMACHAHCHKKLLFDVCFAYIYLF